MHRNVHILSDRQYLICLVSPHLRLIVLLTLLPLPLSLHLPVTSLPNIPIPSCHFFCDLSLRLPPPTPYPPTQDANYPRIPIIGNGDIFSWEDWNGHCDKIQSDVTGGSGRCSVVISSTVSAHACLDIYLLVKRCFPNVYMFHLSALTVFPPLMFMLVCVYLSVPCVSSCCLSSDTFEDVVYLNV